VRRLALPPVKTDYDSPWKDILESYFQSALELCFPQIARQINWSKGVQLLSKEFQKIVRRSELGRRSVDAHAIRSSTKYEIRHKY
jgi:hypothetical protein